jgi:hypothetical protein
VADVTALLSLGDQIAQLIRFLERRKLGEDDLVFGGQLFFPVLPLLSSQAPLERSGL